MKRLLSPIDLVVINNFVLVPMYQRIDHVNRPIRGQGPSIKYVTLFLANFDPLPLSHFVSHIPGPPKVRHTSRTPHF